MTAIWTAGQPATQVYPRPVAVPDGVEPHSYPDHEKPYGCWFDENGVDKRTMPIELDPVLLAERN